MSKTFLLECSENQTLSLILLTVQYVTGHTDTLDNTATASGEATGTAKPINLATGTITEAGQH